MSAHLEHVHSVWGRMRTNSPIYSFLLNRVEIYHAEPGLIRAKLPIEAHHVNSKGTLHGVLSSCLVDWVGGMAVASHGRQSTGLSTDLHVSFTAGAKEGDILVVEGRTAQIGKTLAFTNIIIWKGEGKSSMIVAQGSHTKVVSI